VAFHELVHLTEAATVVVSRPWTGCMPGGRCLAGRP